MAFTTDTLVASISFGERFSQLRDRWSEAAEKRKMYMTTKAELEMLSNRDLADLGLSRSMIKGIALEAAYGKNV